MYRNFENAPNANPNLETVTAAYQDVLAFNAEHTDVSKAVIDIINATYDSATSVVDPKSFEQSLEQATSESDMHRDITQLISTNILENIGITLDKGTRLKSSIDTPVGSHKLVPLVVDADLFKQFLSDQSQSEMQEDAKNYALIVDVIKSLHRQTTEGFSTASEFIDPLLREQLNIGGELALRAFDTIRDELELLGLASPKIYEDILLKGSPAFNGKEYQEYMKAKTYIASYKDLDAYYEYWTQDLLEQYIRTGSPERLQQEKLMYLDGETMNAKLVKLTEYILKLTRSESDTIQSYGRRSAAHLQQGIQATILTMKTNPHEWYATVQNRTLLQSIEIDIESTLEQ